MNKIRIIKKLIVLLSVLTFIGLVHTNKALALELLMLEQDNCHWCDRWHAEIGDIYPKTNEGKKAPLVQINIHEKLPDKYSSLISGSFTPTFVLWENGLELGRLRGYPGEDFFWALLDEMFKKHANGQPAGNLN